MQTIAVVILNWNGKNWLEKFLPSVVSHSAIPNAKVIVADNGSTDDSVEYLQKEWPFLETIILDKNYGFAGGYNKALAQVQSDYYVILNSDVETTEGWLNDMFEYLIENPDIVAAMPKILAHNQKTHFEYAGACGGFIDKYGYPFCRGRIFDALEEDLGQYNSVVPIFWATGACLFIKAEIFHNIGGFDEDFFAHMEEIDLCWRIQNMGYSIVCQPAVTVYHYGGGSLPQGNSRKVFLNHRNNLYLLLKNTKGFQMLKVLFVRLILDGLSGVKYLLAGSVSSFWAVIRAHWAFFFSISKTLKKKSKKITSMKNVNGFYAKSIVWQFFIKKKRKYIDLPQIS